MVENNEKLEKDRKIIQSIQKIKKADLTIQKSYHTIIFVIFLIVLYFASIFSGLSISDLFLLWAIVTPYGLFLINHFRNKDNNKSKLMVFVQEVKELLYTINFLSKTDNKSSIKEKFNFLNEFKEELKKMHCYIIEKEGNPTLLIYTNKGKYEASKDNIIRVYPISDGIKSILNQDDPIGFINNIIEELKRNL